MKQLLKVTLSVLALGLATSNAFAKLELGKSHDERSYVYVRPQGSVGAIQNQEVTGGAISDATLTVDHNCSYGFGLAVGVAGIFGMSDWRLEGEFHGTKAKIKSFTDGTGKVEEANSGLQGFQTWTMNLLYDMMLNDMFDLNLGVGLGVANNQYEPIVIPGLEINDMGRKFTQFAWKLIAGLTFNMNEKIALTTAYNFSWGPKLAFGNSDLEWNNMLLHSFVLGLQFKVDI